MKAIDKMKKIGKEIILGNDTNLNQLKEMIDDFFKDKNQEFFDSLNQEELKKVIALSEKIRIINEISRAYLDYVLNPKKPLKYAWIEVEGKFSVEKIRLIKETLINDANLGIKENENLDKWIEWIIKDSISWDDSIFENESKDLHIEIDITGYFEIPEIKIFMIGDKKYNGLMKNIEKMIKQKITSNVSK